MYPAGVAGVRARWVTLPSGVRVRVAESGERGRPAVLLLHGWGASIYTWRHWFSVLADSGRYVIAPDLPGHGLSDKPGDADCYRLESLTSLVRELLDAEGLSGVDVVAQSMAGTIAIELATEEPTRVGRTVLVNPACFGRVRLERVMWAARYSFADVVLPHLVVRWIVARTHRLVYGDPTRISNRDIDEQWAPSQFPSFARAARLLVHEFRWARPPVAEMASRLRSLGKQMLVVLGTRDRLIIDASDYVTALCVAGAPLEVHEIAGGGHAVNEERPEEVSALALAFLRR